MHYRRRYRGRCSLQWRWTVEVAAWNASESSACLSRCSHSLDFQRNSPRTRSRIYVQHWQQKISKTFIQGDLYISNNRHVWCFQKYFHESLTKCWQLLARDSIYAIARDMLSPVRPSVCLSVCLSDQSKTVEVRIMQPSPQSSPMTLFFWRLTSPRNSL